MEIKEPYFYDEVPLSFDLGGEQISGTLAGSFKVWYFHSQSPAFLKFFPNGVLTSFMLDIDPKAERYIIVENMLTAGKAKGCSFDPENEGLL